MGIQDMLMKKHKIAGKGGIVAVCDRELINTRITHGDLEIFVDESFYGTEPATSEEVRDAITAAESVNLIGIRAVSVAEDMGLITRSGCIMIGDVPHAQIYRI